MARLQNRVEVRRGLEQQGVVEKKGKGGKTAPAILGPATSTHGKSKGGKKTTSKSDPEGKGKASAPKQRGMKGKLLGLPAYATWTAIFTAQCEVRDKGRATLGTRKLTKPMTDAEITAFVNEEFDGKCKEAPRVGYLRSLFNRGKINKQEAKPVAALGEYTAEGEWVMRDREAKRQAKAAAKSEE